MKIYDFESFEKNCKNVKAIKYKKLKDVPKRYFSEELFYFFNKKFKATFILTNCYFSWTNIWLNIFCEDEKNNKIISLDRTTFKDFIEYVEIKSSLEIE